MKTTSTVRVVEHEGRKFSATYTAAGMVAYEIVARKGQPGYVDMVPLDASDPAALPLIAANEPTTDPNAARYREALENLLKIDGSGFALPSQVADSVRAYCRDVLNGAKAGT